MLSFTGALKILVALEPYDMRKGFNGLHAAVAEHLKEDVRSGTLYVFTNKKHTRLKVLYWDGSGLWLMTKRLEQGTFSWPKGIQTGATKLHLVPEAFAMLTDGIDLRAGTLRPWYQRNETGLAAAGV